MKSKYVIRDPINGDISLNETEKKIIDTQNFQFLRKIKQLGLTYLVYPGATNTRFEHSIGVLHITNEISQSLLDDETLQKLRIAGLLHDIGHCAFSHEGEFAAELNHEKKGLEIIKNSEINDVVRENFSTKDIKKIIDFYSGNDFGYLITSAIGSDRIDYLLRDAYYTGVAYGIIDKNRIAQIFKLNNNSLHMQKNNLIYVEENEIEVVESIIIARFMMFMNVYNHKTVRSFSAMLKFAISKAIQEQKISKDDMYSTGDE
ncbi:MAG: HD domain-containing protein, partial [Candidatus Aenigmatarchaeota archaeon]